jgi:hypothetical protein
MTDTPQPCPEFAEFPDGSQYVFVRQSDEEIVEKGTIQNGELVPTFKAEYEGPALVHVVPVSVRVRANTTVRIESFTA